MKGLSRSERRAIWNEAAADVVAPLAGWGSLLFAVFAVAHRFVLTQVQWRLLIPVALGTSLTMAVTYLCTRKRRPAIRWAHPLATGLILLAVVNSAVHLYISRDPLQSTNFVLVFVGAGVLLLSQSAYLLVLGMGFAAFLAVAVTSQSQPEHWIHMSFALLSGAVLGMVAVTYRQRMVLRLAQSESNLRDKGVKLESALERAGQEIQRREEVERDLRELGQELEARVEARTGELADSNARLEREIREKQAAELELENKREQLQRAERLETAGLLAGGVAHDFNNVLTVILACAELTKHQVPQSERLMTQIEKAAGQASELTRKLLAFGRKQVMQTRPTSMNKVILGNETLLTRMLGHHVRLVLDLDPDLEKAQVDPSQFEQVFMNLAINARDAMPKGGTLTVGTHNVELGEGEVLGLPAGRYVMCETVDTGVGMDDIVKGRLFEPFFTTKGNQGNGLGLASVHGIIKQSAGDIQVESEPGRGTAFRFWIPVYDGDSLVVEPPVFSAQQTICGGRVLVVDDNPAVLERLRDALRSAGYDVLAASGGPEALQILAEDGGELDAVVSDVLMSPLDGYELVNQILAVHPTVRVLFISAYSADKLRDLPMGDMGGVAALQKPFPPSVLMQHLSDLLSQPSGRTVPPPAPQGG